MRIERSDMFKLIKAERDISYTRKAETISETYKKVYDQIFKDYTFPGWYPIIYTTEHDDMFCSACARKYFTSRDGGLIDKDDISINTDIYSEGPIMYCDGCNTEIESAYGDPENL